MLIYGNLHIRSFMYTNTLGTYKYTKDDIPCFSKKVLKRLIIL